MQYIFSNVAFLDYKPFLFYHNSILPKKRQEHAQKKSSQRSELKQLKTGIDAKKKNSENNNNDDYNRILYSV